MNISCSENRHVSTPRYYMAKAMALGASNSSADEAAPATEISSGVVKIYANADVTFYVK
jgi:hypothetical protein